LGRDIQDEMFEHMFDFFDILTALVDKASLCGENVSACTTERQADPEMTGKIFECMSHLIRYLVLF
jgi:hypothetical protein